MRLAALVAMGVLAFPASACAHATLVRTAPRTGGIVNRAPRQIRVIFDDAVRIGSGNAAVANATGKSVLAGAVTVRGRVLSLPLRADLGEGDYTIRWSIASDDGHLEQGLIAFGVGSGRSPPRPALSAGGATHWNDLFFRTLYYFGILLGGGAVAFEFLVRSLGGDMRRLFARLLFPAMALTVLGGTELIAASVSGTRFAFVVEVAVLIALVGCVASCAALVYRPISWVAESCAIALIAAPTLAGHALDRGQPRAFAVPADLAHVAAASVWLGGLASIVFVLAELSQDPEVRSRALRRFSVVAFAVVAVLVLSGIGRAVTELGAFSQVWSSSYGRTIVVKSILLVPLLGLGWLNRTLLRNAVERLRRSAQVESALLFAVVVAVGLLTQLPPGVAQSAPKAVPPVRTSLKQLAFPERDAVVDARGLGGLAVAIARTPGTASISVVGPDGAPQNDHDVRINGSPTVFCGGGCYRGRTDAGAVHVTIDGKNTVFSVPAQAPDGTELLRLATRGYRKARTIVFEQRSESGSGRPTGRAVFTLAAPHRLKYITSDGNAAVIIGRRRWDRDAPGKPFVESPQTPLHLGQPLWSSSTNAHEVAPGVVTFFDRTLMAWFRVTVRKSLPRVAQMTAAGHFMTERYLRFNSTVVIVPPPR